MDQKQFQPKNLLEFLELYEGPRDKFITLKFNIQDAPEEYKSVLEDMFQALDFSGWTNMEAERVKRFCDEAMANRRDYNSPFWDGVIFSWQLAQKEQQQEKRKAGKSSGGIRKQKTLEIIESLAEPIEAFLRGMGDKSKLQRPLKKMVIDELVDDKRYGVTIKKVKEITGSSQEISVFFTYYIDKAMDILSGYPEFLQSYGIEIKKRARRSKESKERSREGALKHFKEKSKEIK